MSDSKEKKPCPQCDGVGQEDVGAIPVQCRKCKGSGEVVTMRRVSVFLDGGEGLEKEAQEVDDLQPDDGSDPAAEAEEPAPADGDGVGEGFDSLSILRGDMDDDQVKANIFTALREFGPDDRRKILTDVCAIRGEQEASVLARLTQENGEAGLDSGITRYVYAAVDGMDRLQLRKFYRGLRFLSSGD